MAIEFPPTVRSTADRYAYCQRLHRRWVLEHNAESAKLPAQPRQTEGPEYDAWVTAVDRFKRWERKTWMPEMRQLYAVLGPLEQQVRRAQSGDDDEKSVRLRQAREAAEVRTEWDADMDLGWI